MTCLPSTWAIAPLGNLIATDGIFTDGDWIESKDQDPNGEIRLIQLADIADSRFLDKSSRFLTRQKADELNCTFLKKRRPNGRAHARSFGTLLHLPA